MDVDHFSICVAAAEGNPGPIAGAKNWFDGGDEAAGGNGDGNGVIATGVNVGLSIRNDEEAAFAQPVADMISQPLSRPLRFVGIAQSCFGLCCSAGAVHRSEEHTSELQSLRHLVCRLL